MKTQKQSQTQLPTQAQAQSQAGLSPVQRLERVLTALLEAHQRMIAEASAQRRALSEADVNGLRACLERQGSLHASVVALERERQEIVGLIARGTVGASGTGSGGAVTMSSIAARATEPARSRLMGVTAALREALLALHAEHAALKAAASALSTHMEGIMRQVFRSLSHSGTYARSGSVDSSVQVVTAIDVKS
jgi:DNA anti-recombination protein RmuC